MIHLAEEVEAQIVEQIWRGILDHDLLNNNPFIFLAHFLTLLPLVLPKANICNTILLGKPDGDWPMRRNQEHSSSLRCDHDFGKPLSDPVFKMG